MKKIKHGALILSLLLCCGTLSAQEPIRRTQEASQKALGKKTESILPTQTAFASPKESLPYGENQEGTTPSRQKQGTPIHPPFGLKWGESPETIISWSEKRGYKRKRYQDKDLTILEVQGPFQNVEFETVRFHFEANKLLEVELQYPSKSNESDGLFQMANIKGILEASQGKGNLQPEERGENEGTFWRLYRYTWENDANALWLVSFQVKEKIDSSHYGTVSITSLHYRTLTEKEQL